jgi:hypothetical protein
MLLKDIITHSSFPFPGAGYEQEERWRWWWGIEEESAFSSDPEVEAREVNISIGDAAEGDQPN